MSGAAITKTDAELAALLAEARASNDPDVLARALPYFAFLGVTMEKDDRGILAKMRFAEDLVGDASIPALHGGTISALLESTAIFAVLWSRGDVDLPKTITLTIDYLLSGRPIETRCRARIVRQGKRIAVVESRAFQEDEEQPIATAIVHVLTAD
jgi:uncharacterized protein (TIGR00369 family)